MALTKYRVTMTNKIVGAGGVTSMFEAKDYVPTDILDAYVADAKTKWQQVDVSALPDYGPGGLAGLTITPPHL